MTLDDLIWAKEDELKKMSKNDIINIILEDNFRHRCRKLDLKNARELIKEMEMLHEAAKIVLLSELGEDMSHVSDDTSDKIDESSLLGLAMKLIHSKRTPLIERNK